MAPERCGSNFTSSFSKLILRVNILSIYCRVVLRWEPYWWWVNIGSGSSLVPSLATSHYLSLCWPRTMLPYHMASVGHDDLTCWRSHLFSDTCLSDSFMGHHYETWMHYLGMIIFFYNANPCNWSDVCYIETGVQVYEKRCMLIWYTVECCYDAVEFVMILHSAQRWQRQNINQTLDSQKTPHISPSRASYGVCVVRI